MFTRVWGQRDNSCGVQVSSFRTQHLDASGDLEEMQLNLNQAENLREQALIRMTIYKNKISQIYNSRVKPRVFNIDDLVFRWFDVIGRDAEFGKLGETGKDNLGSRRLFVPMLISWLNQMAMPFFIPRMYVIYENFINKINEVFFICCDGFSYME